MTRKIKLYEVETTEDKLDRSIYQKLDEFIQENYIIQYNEIALIYEFSNRKEEQSFVPLNKSSLLIAMVNSGLRISNQTVDTYLKSDYVTRVNPIIRYFKSLDKWNGVDYIKQFASYVETDDNVLFEYHLKKWCVRAVLSIFYTDRINKHCIVLANGDQHAGKSTYLNFLTPKALQQYASENIGLDKDSRIKLCKTFIINIEELDVIGLKDVNSLKAFISQTWVNERLPYSDRAENIPRICSFIASTNRTEILNDDTGSVRWIVFEVRGRLNFAYSKQFDIDNLWSQAFHLAFNEPSFIAELSRDDVLTNEKRNEAYTIQSVEREVIRTYYELSEALDDFRTATEIVEQLRPLGHKLANNRIGGALSRYNFKRVKHSKRGVYGYLAKPLFRDSPLEMKI